MNRLTNQPQHNPGFHLYMWPNLLTPFGLFAWRYRELTNSLLALFATGLKVDLNPQPFEEGLIDVTTQLPRNEGGKFSQGIHSMLYLMKS